MFLLDENTPASLQKFLTEQELPARRISEIEKGASDRRVVKIAKSMGAVVVTLDSDFTKLCFLERVPVILIKVHPRTPQKVVSAVKKFFKTFKRHKRGLLIITENGAFKRRF